jgi:glucose/arabinose dehydrogenase
VTPEHTRRRFLASVGAAGSAAVAGCIFDDGPDIGPVETPYDLSLEHDIENWERYDPEWSAPETSPADATFGYETVIENLEIPWDMSFADDRTLFFSERVGRISRYEAGEIETVTEPEDVIDHATAVSPEFQGEDWWGGGSEGGLLGIAVHPNYPGVPVLYAYYTYQSDDGGRNEDPTYSNRLVLYDLEDDAEEYVVVDGIPGHRIIHNGARVAFGPRNYLWVTTGDSGEKPLAQDTGSLAGKILRLKPDGTPPEDNPGFEDPRIHTLGHRNPQSISWFPDGTAVAGEHGEHARDEVNVIEGGDNYGWPDARGGPDDDTYGAYPEFPEFTPPVVNTGPGETWAPPGGVVYTGDDVPALAGRFVLGGLISQRLNVVSIYAGEAPDIGGTRFDADWMHPEYEAVAHAFLEDELGRIRHVEQGPNGELYAVTSNRDGRSSEPEENSFPTGGDDRLVRIVQE